MSTTVRATCPTCGCVEVPIAAAQLVIGLHRNERGNVVEFRCPACAALWREPADERTTRLLSRAGIVVAAAAHLPASEEPVHGDGAA